MAEIKPGDVVQLKSGGPRMTVQSVGNYNFGKGADCRWFAGHDVKDAIFSVETLELSSDADGRRSSGLATLAEGLA